MGWSFGCTSKKQQVAELLAHTGSVRTRTVLKHSLKGNVLWTVEEIGPAPDGSQGSVRFIGCYLFKYTCGMWGYKGLEESMEPYYYTVPTGYFSLVPETEPGTKPAWRKEIIERRRIEKMVRLRQIPMGQVWCCRYGRADFQVTGYHGHTQVVGCIEGRPGLYRVPHYNLERPVGTLPDKASLSA